MTKSTNWARDLAQSIIRPEDLVDQGIIESKDLPSFLELKKNFDFKLPRTFLQEIKENNTALRKQFIPSREELLFLPEELEDPIGDLKFSPVPGIIHRYPDRVLLTSTYLCGVYCRFCFRRSKVSKAKNNLTELELENAFSYIASHSNIWEVILTGGDPLILTNKSLEKIIQRISSIEHVKIIRFHTRVPSVLSSRIDLSLIELFKKSRKTIWIAVHINSVEEFTPKASQALNLLVDNGIPVVLQSVLLKGINDSKETLIQLFKAAVEHRIRPYYLHYPDLAKGTHHFRIPLTQAIELMKELKGAISGLCVPQFIIDIPQGHGKISISPHSARMLSSNIWEFESPLTGEKIKVQYPVS